MTPARQHAEREERGEGASGRLGHQGRPEAHESREHETLQLHALEALEVRDHEVVAIERGPCWIEEAHGEEVDRFQRVGEALLADDDEAVSVGVVVVDLEICPGQADDDGARAEEHGAEAGFVATEIATLVRIRERVCYGVVHRPCDEHLLVERNQCSGLRHDVAHGGAIDQGAGLSGHKAGRDGHHPEHHTHAGQRGLLIAQLRSPAVARTATGEGHAGDSAPGVARILGTRIVHRFASSGRGLWTSSPGAPFLCHIATGHEVTSLMRGVVG